MGLLGETLCFRAKDPPKRGSFARKKLEEIVILL